MVLVTIRHHTDTAPKPSSDYLETASISQDGSIVTVYCELVDDYPTASCVLVYREYTNTTLGVRVYNGNTTFPITITGENYTFAVFGRENDKHIDRTPLVTERIVFEDTVASATVIFVANRLPETPPPSPTSPPPPGKYIGSYCMLLTSFHENR